MSFKLQCTNCTICLRSLDLFYKVIVTVYKGSNEYTFTVVPSRHLGSLYLYVRDTLSVSFRVTSNDFCSQNKITFVYMCIF